MCHICHHAETLPNDILCQACHDYLSPATHYGRWDSPELAYSLDQAEGGQHELSEANLSRRLSTFQSETETARAQRRAEMRESYRQTLHERKVVNDTREQALIHALGTHEQNEILASVAASEEAEHEQSVREDARYQTALVYREVLRSRINVVLEPRGEAVTWVRQHLRHEADISSVAASKEQDYQGDISNNSETLLRSYRRLLSVYTRGDRHSREASLQLGRLQLGHHPNFAQVVAQEEEEYRDYLRDEARADLNRRYRSTLHDRMEHHQGTREAALAWLQQHTKGVEVDWAEVARSGQDCEGQRRNGTAGGCASSDSAMDGHSDGLGID